LSNLGEVVDPFEKLINIILDTRIDKTLSESFQKHFKYIWDKEVKGKNHKESLEKIVFFVYRVRNNIFHGQKNTIQMMDSGQQERLRIYSAILSSLNHLLFVVAEQKLSWSKPDVKVGSQRIDDCVKWENIFLWSKTKST
jgi:hypothetical protein